MRYFCDVHIQSRKDEERRTFIVLDKENFSENEIPKLTKDILFANNQYKEFCQKYKPKMILAEYTVYSTEKEIFASSQDEVFEELIESESAKKLSQSELNIDCAKDKISLSKKKKKMSPALKVGIIGGTAVMLFVSFGLGSMLGKSKVQGDVIQNIETAPNEDGMIIPEQEVFAEDTQQITVSIDRSYSAVPREDLQLKGEVVDGVAQITLPEFDKTDFFTHVAGYTWGFTTNPDGKKIEYYGGATYSFAKDTKLYRVLVKYGGGSGTKDDPYLIDYYDQLELMSEEKARGYFRQTADISFPEWAVHTPIDTVNELKNNPDSEYFEYDGNGFIISNLTDSLFGKVSGAVIKNVNIQNSSINTPIYKNYGFVVCEAYNYQYTAENGVSYETGETLIQNCTVSHSGIYVEYPVEEETEAVTEIVTAQTVVPPNLVKYDDKGNVVTTTEPKTIEPTKYGEYAIGAVTGIGGQIENCYVTDFGIYANIDEYFLYAGGISGKPANVINSAVYYFSAQGNIFNAGGIAGNISGAKLYDPTGQEIPDYYGGNIQGCLARNIIFNTEVSAGGIVGESGTNTENAVISNCYANQLDFTVGIFDKDGIQLKSGFTGGIIGTDGKENNGHLISNTVSPTELHVIGNKITSMYDDTVRLAPAYAFYQENILTVLNKNTINPKKPKEIYTGNFMFEGSLFGDDNGSLPFPSEIKDLFEKTFVEE